MRVDAFDFELPEDRIALRPAQPRDSARLLVANRTAPGSIHDSTVSALPEFLDPGDALVFNDTKVIPAQLEGVRRRGEAVAHIGATLHMRVAPNKWRAFVRGTKKLKVGEEVQFRSDDPSNADTGLVATVTEIATGGEVEFLFETSGPRLDARIAHVGHIPLPPYIASKRADDERDRSDYQTVYAREEGAVAAPTAGLHFTDTLLGAIEKHGISVNFVTLHVGAGTFLPVKVDDTDEHKMHAEVGSISSQTARVLNETKSNGNRVICVGTTSLRLLESAAMVDGGLTEWSGATDIFITPGYNFRIVDALMTNFHLPRSTLMMLVSAFSGLHNVRDIYRHAIENGYKFYSYGDASLLFPSE